MPKLSYAKKILRQRLTRSGMDSTCLYCGAQAKRVGHKYFLLSLWQCPSCALRFRLPRDIADDAQSFYDDGYDEVTTTVLPTDAQIDARDLHYYLKDRVGFLKHIADTLLPGTVIDWGSSWGYVADWLKRHGASKAVGFEISRPRAQFGRDKMDMEIHSDHGALIDAHPEKFDVLVTSHVLEHLPDFSYFFKAIPDLVKVGGHLAICVPNGSDGHIRKSGWPNFGPMVSEVHTMALSYPFFRHALKAEGYEIVWQGPEDGPEVQIFAKRLPASA